MNKIDTSSWKKFKVSDIFITVGTETNLQVPTGANLKTRDLIDGKTPRVTVTNFNNGIVGYYDDLEDSNYRVYENFISVSFLGTVFYQANRASLDMKVHCLKLIDIELNERIACFLVSLIRKEIEYFAYSDQLSSTVLPLLEIKLPVNSQNNPDWDYMDLFMENIMNESKESLNNLKKALTI